MERSSRTDRRALGPALPSLLVAAVLAVLLGIAAPAPVRAGSMLGDLIMELVFGGDEAAVMVATTPADPEAAANAEAPIYSVVEDAVHNFTPQVSDLERTGATVGAFKAAVAQVTADPYYNYVAGYRYTYREDAAELDDCTLSAFELEFAIEFMNAASYEQSLDASISYLTDAVPQDASDFDRVRYAHDYLVKLCSYDAGATDASHTAYGALVLRQAANRGYAHAFTLLLRELGVESITVESLETGVPWNMVLLDGAWYHVDVTWDDQGDGERPSYQYFLRGDETFARSHEAWSSPQVAHTDYAVQLIGATSADRVAFAMELWRRAIEAGSEQLAGVEFYGISMDEAYAAFDELIKDPWYDYVAEHGVVYYEDAAVQGDCTVAALTLSYHLSEEQIASYRTQMEAAVAGALEWAAGAQTDYDKVLAIHDYLVRTCAYDEAPTGASHTAYGALVQGVAVCQGYADAYQMLLGKLGVSCLRVSSLEMGHGWNMVCLDDVWYHVDVTWDDPTPDRGYEAEVSYVHFLRSDAVMLDLGHYGWESPEAAPYDYWL